MPQFDYIGAKKAGATDEQIMSFLKDNGINFDLAGAKKAGATDEQIGAFLNDKNNLVKKKENTTASIQKSSTYSSGVSQSVSAKQGSTTKPTTTKPLPNQGITFKPLTKEQQEATKSILGEPSKSTAQPTVKQAIQVEVKKQQDDKKQKVANSLGYDYNDIEQKATDIYNYKIPIQSSVSENTNINITNLELEKEKALQATKNIELEQKREFKFGDKEKDKIFRVSDNPIYIKDVIDKSVEVDNQRELEGANTTIPITERFTKQSDVLVKPIYNYISTEELSNISANELYEANEKANDRETSYNYIKKKSENIISTKYETEQKALSLKQKGLQERFTQLDNVLKDKYGEDYQQNYNNIVQSDKEALELGVVVNALQDNYQKSLNLIDNNEYSELKETLKKEEEYQRKSDEISKNDKWWKIRDEIRKGKYFLGNTILGLTNDIASLPRTIAGGIGFNNYGITDKIADKVEEFNGSILATMPLPTNTQRSVNQKYVDIDGYKIFTDSKGNPLSVRDSEGFKVFDKGEESKIINKYNANKDSYKLRTDYFDTETILNQGGKIIGDMASMMVEGGIYGAVFKGFSKASKIGKIAKFADNLAESEKLKTFLAITTQTQNEMFNDAISKGMTPTDASRYSILSASMIGAVSMINPMEARLLNKLSKGKPKLTSQQVQLFNQGKLTFSDLSKNFLGTTVKNIAGEGFEENFGEIIGQNVVNEIYNNKVAEGEEFEVEKIWTSENLGNLALTAFTTLIPSAVEVGFNRNLSEARMAVLEEPEEYIQIITKQAELGLITEDEASKKLAEHKELSEKFNSLKTEVEPNDQPILAHLLHNRQILNKRIKENPEVKEKYTNAILENENKIQALIKGEKIEESKIKVETKEGASDLSKQKAEQPVKTQQEQQAIEAQIDDIERRMQEELEKPFKTFNDGSNKMVTVTTETTEKDGIKKIKFKTQTTNKKGEPRTQNDKGYNTFEEAVENLGIDLESETNETALELVEALKKSSGRETLPSRVIEIRESTDKSSPFYGLKTATVIVGGEKIEFRLKNDTELAALESTETETTNDLESKKADIERRRQENPSVERGVLINYESGKTKEQLIDIVNKLKNGEINLNEIIKEFFNLPINTLSEVKEAFKEGTLADKIQFGLDTNELSDLQPKTRSRESIINAKQKALFQKQKTEEALKDSEYRTVKKTDPITGKVTETKVKRTAEEKTKYDDFHKKALEDVNEEIEKYDAELKELENNNPTLPTNETEQTTVAGEQSVSTDVEAKKADIERRRQELESSREIETLYDITKPITEDSKEIISKIEKANKLRKESEIKRKQAAKETNEEKRIYLNSAANSLNEKAQILDKEVKTSRDSVINNTPIKQAINSAWSIGQKLLNKIKLAAKSNEWVSSMPISKEEFAKLEDATKRLAVKKMGEVTSNSEVIPDILLIEEINAKYDAELAALEGKKQELLIPKTEQNAIQEQITDKSMLRTEEPKVELQKVEGGNAETQIVTEQGKTTENEVEINKTKEAFTQKAKEAFGLTDKQAKGIVEIVNSVGKSFEKLGIMTENEYWSGLPDIQEGTKPTETGDIVQNTEGKANGFINLTKNIITSLTKGNVSTPIHEMSHHWLKVLDNAVANNNAKAKEILAPFEDFAKEQGAKSFTQRHELFARSFEKYLSTGEAPNNKLKKVFEDFKNWMKEVYGSITGSDIDVNISPKVKEMFDKIVSGEESKIVPKEQVKKVEEKLQGKELLSNLANVIFKKKQQKNKYENAKPTTSKTKNASKQDSQSNKEKKQQEERRDIKTVRKVKGTPKTRRKIVNPEYKKALRHDVSDARDIVMQELIGGKKIHSDIIKSLYKNSKGEVKLKLDLLDNKNGVKTIGEFAHYLWENQPNEEFYTTSDFESAIEDVLNSYNTRRHMVDDLNSRYKTEEELLEEEINKYYNLKENIDDVENYNEEDVNDAIEYYNSLTKEDIIELEKGSEEILKIQIEEYFDKEEYKTNIEYKDVIEEINAKPLTHVRGKNMGEGQALGTYISTEEGNRYETKDKKAERVNVEIENPLVVEGDLGLINKRQEILNKNRDKFSKDDSIDYQELPSGKLTIDDLNESGIKKLAELTTNELKLEGYDSIYFRESNIQEGELVVFNKSKVLFKEEDLFQQDNKVKPFLKEAKNQGMSLDDVINYLEENEFEYNKQDITDTWNSLEEKKEAVKPTTEKKGIKEQTVNERKNDIINRSKDLGSGETKERVISEKMRTLGEKEESRYDRTDSQKSNNLAIEIMSEYIANENSFVGGVNNLLEVLNNISGVDLDKSPHLAYLKSMVEKEILAKSFNQVQKGFITEEQYKDIQSKVYEKSTQAGKALAGSIQDELDKQLMTLRDNIKAKQKAELAKKTEDGVTKKEKLDEVVNSISEEATKAVTEATKSDKSKTKKAVDDVVKKQQTEKKPKTKKIVKEIEDLITDFFSNLEQKKGILFQQKDWRKNEKLRVAIEGKIKEVIQSGEVGSLKEIIDDIYSGKIKEFIPRKDFEDFINTEIAPKYKVSIAKLEANSLAETIKKGLLPKEVEVNTEKDIIEKVKEALIKKYKSENKSDKKKTEKDILNDIAERVQNNDIADEMWVEAYEKVKGFIENNENIDEDKKVSLLDSLKNYIEKAKGKPFTKNEIRQAVRQNISQEEMRNTINELVITHYKEANKQARTLAEKLVEDLGLSYTEAKTIIDAIEEDIRDRVSKKAESYFKGKKTALQKIKEGVTRKPRKTQLESIVDTFLRYGNLADNVKENYKEIYGELGIPTIDNELMEQMYDLAQSMKTTGGAISEKIGQKFNDLYAKMSSKSYSNSKLIWDTLESSFMANILGKLTVAVRSAISTGFAGGMYAINQSVADLMNLSYQKYIKGNENLSHLSPFDILSFAFGNQDLTESKKDSILNRFKQAGESIWFGSPETARLYGGNKGLVENWFRDILGTDKKLNYILKNPLSSIYSIFSTPPILLLRSLGAMDEFFKTGAYKAQLARIKGKELIFSGIKYGSKEYYAGIQEGIIKTTEQIERVNELLNKEIEIAKSNGVTLTPPEIDLRRREIEVEMIGDNAQLALQRMGEAVISGMVSPIAQFGINQLSIKNKGDKYIQELMSSGEDKNGKIVLYNALRFLKLIGKSIVPVIHMPMRGFIYGLNYVPVVGLGVGMLDESLAKMKKIDKNYITDEDKLRRLLFQQTTGGLIGLGLMGSFYSMGEDDDDDEEKRGQIQLNKNFMFWGGYDADLAKNYPDTFRPFTLVFKIKGKYHSISVRDNPLLLAVYPFGHITNKIAKRDMLRNQVEKDGSFKTEYEDLREELSGSRLKNYIANVLGGIPQYFTESRFGQGIGQILMLATGGGSDYERKQAITTLTTNPLRVTPLQAGEYMEIADMIWNKEDYKKSDKAWVQEYNYIIQNSVFNRVGNTPDKLDVLGNKVYAELNFDPVSFPKTIPYIFTQKRLSKEMEDTYNFVFDKNLSLRNDKISASFSRELNDYFKDKDDEKIKALKEIYLEKEGALPMDANFKKALKDKMQNEVKQKWGEYMVDFAEKNKNNDNMIKMQETMNDELTSIISEIKYEYLGIKKKKSSKKISRFKR